MRWLFILAVLLSACSAAVDLPTVTPAVDSTQAIFAKFCTVSTGVPEGGLNLRTGAGTEYSVIRVLNEGEVLRVITTGQWLEVIDSQGNQGFINSTYCEG